MLIILISLKEKHNTSNICIWVRVSNKNQGGGEGKLYHVIKI